MTHESVKQKECFFAVKIHQFKTLPDYKEIKGTAAYLGKNVSTKQKN